MNITHLIPAYKYGKPVLTGSGVEGSYNSKAVDCPNVFTHNGKFYMIHVGFDGTGYQTALDSKYAHKPSVIYHDGALYHYYCACRPHMEGDPADNDGEFRCITVARTKPW